MKHILQVLKFEYLSCIKNKSFIITTIILIALILLVSFLPILLIGNLDSSDSNSEGNAPVIAINNKAYNDNSIIEKEFSAAYKNYDIKITDENETELKNKVDDQSYDFAVVLNSPTTYTYITKNNSMFSDTESNLNNVIKSVYRIDTLSHNGISAEQADKILNTDITSNTITTSTDQTKNYISTYTMIMLLYMAIIMYGQMVSTSVVSEKNTRAMEMLITCAKPSHLMFGKVIGSGLAGLTQLAIIAVVGIASIGTISSNALPGDIKEFISFPISTILYALLFFIIGYFIYAFLLGAFSSLASRTEDLNTLITPIMMIFIIAFMIVVYSINTSAIDGVLMQVCSYIPFTAPIAMFARITMSDVAIWEIIISIAVQLISVYLLGMLAAAIYKMGVLMYGKPPKFTEIIKMLKEQHTANKKIKQNSK